MNLVDLIAANADHDPTKIAIIEDDRTTAYGQLLELIQKTAGWLANLGLQQGDRIVLMLPNNLEFILCYLGAAAYGVQVVPINWLCRELEIKYYLSNSSAAAVLTLAKFVPVVSKAATDLATRPRVIALDRVTDDGTSFIETLADIPPKPLSNLSQDTVAAIVYTNAVDGYPRGAMLSHLNLQSNALMSAAHWNPKPEDRLGAVLPFFHTYGATTSILSPLLRNMAIVLMPHFNPKEVCTLIQKHRPTIFSAVPTMYAGLLGFEQIKDYDLTSVRIWISGGMALSPRIHVAFERLLNTEIREGYGITEASPCASFNWLEHPRKIGSIGKILRGMRGIIADPEGREVPRLSTGELLLKGDTIMIGYLNDRALTEQTIVDGWLHTGDLGYMDDEGYVFLTGRLREMLISGGFNVYPREVERLLVTHPEIAAVEVQAKPDPIYGEVGHARITLHPGSTLTEESVASYCRRVMALYKIPRTFEILI